MLRQKKPEEKEEQDINQKFYEIGDDKKWRQQTKLFYVIYKTLFAAQSSFFVSSRFVHENKDKKTIIKTILYDLEGERKKNPTSRSANTATILKGMPSEHLYGELGYLISNPSKNQKLKSESFAADKITQMQTAYLELFKNIHKTAWDRSSWWAKTNIKEKDYNSLTFENLKKIKTKRRWSLFKSRSQRIIESLGCEFLFQDIPTSTPTGSESSLNSRGLIHSSPDSQNQERKFK